MSYHSRSHFAATHAGLVSENGLKIDVESDLAKAPTIHEIVATADEGCRASGDVQGLVMNNQQETFVLRSAASRSMKHPNPK
jgi:hypothetical protein